MFPVKVTQGHPLFRVEEVSFRNGGVRLSGSLRIPVASGPHPAVVMVHGEGPADREMWGLAPSDYFAQRGIAVLTYDKRGVGGSTGDWKTATFHELVEDVLAGVEFFKGRKEIDVRKIGLWGISQGGWLCPMAAACSSDIAFLVIVGAPSGTVREQQLQRVVHEILARGYSREKAEEALAEYRGLYDLFEDPLQSDAQVKRACRACQAQWWWESIQPGITAEYFFEMLSGTLRNPRPESKIHPDSVIDPRTILPKVQCPVLAIYGEKDRSIPPETNAPLLERYLKEGGNQDVTVRVFPNANHVLLLCRTGSQFELRRMLCDEEKRSFAAGYFEEMAEWILR